MTTFEWISVDDPRKPEMPEGEHFSGDLLLLVCDEEGYWYELGCYSRSGCFVRHDDPVGCRVRYWAPLLVPPFPPPESLAADLAAVQECFRVDREECRKNKNQKVEGE